MIRSQLKGDSMLLKIKKTSTLSSIDLWFEIKSSIENYIQIETSNVFYTILLELKDKKRSKKETIELFFKHFELKDTETTKKLNHEINDERRFLFLNISRKFIHYLEDNTFVSFHDDGLYLIIDSEPALSDEYIVEVIDESNCDIDFDFLKTNFFLDSNHFFKIVYENINNYAKENEDIQRFIEEKNKTEEFNFSSYLKQLTLTEVV